jgi:pseudaminic acid synthase
MNALQIGNRKVGPGHPVFIIAEISCNHLQKKSLALRMISEAKKAGADAVKFQTYTPDTMTIDCSNKHFRIKGTVWNGMNLYKLYQEAYTPWGWFPEIAAKAKKEGIIFFSTPFDETAADLLQKLRVPAYKIASFEINHIPLLKHVAKKGKPVIFSTGVATRRDIELAVRTLRGSGARQIGIMKCTSAYPAPIEEANLATIADMARRYNAVVGLSDHTNSLTVPAYAVAQGACMVEKHFTLEKKGHDAKFSVTPKEFSEMVKNIREAEASRGKATYSTTSQVAKHKFIMRSIFAVADIAKGERFTRRNVRVIRPGYGLHPKHYEKLIGARAAVAIKRGTPVSFRMVG